MFDYALLGRPIVIHAADWEAYRLARGTYFDLTAEPPGRVCRTADEIAGTLATGAHAAPAAAAQLAAFRRRFCPYDDGHAAERVVRHVFLGEAGYPPLPGPRGVARGVPGVLPRPHGECGGAQRMTEVRKRGVRGRRREPRSYEQRGSRSYGQRRHAHRRHGSRTHAHPAQAVPTHGSRRYG